MYNNTADDIAEYYGVTTRIVTQWAKTGYPLRKAGETVKVRLIGAQQVGAQWRFNLKAVVNFIENLGNETWVSKNVLIPQRTERRKSHQIGHTNSISTTSDFSEALMALVSEQKHKQSKNASA